MTKISNYVRPGSQGIVFPSTPGSTVVAPLVGGLVPYDKLGTGGDGSGDHRLGDDGTWHDVTEGGSTIEGAGSVEVIIGGGGSEITTGLKAYIEVPFDCTINAARLAADQPGSIVVDIWRDTYGDFPPLDAVSITAGTPPTLSSLQISQDTTLSGWSTALSKGDWLAFNVDSATTVTRVTVSLTFRRAWQDLPGSPLTNKGDIYVFSTDDDRLPVSGTDGRVLSENSATSTGLEWIDAPSGAAAYEDLTDVDMTGITDGQIPVWDDGTSTWLPGDASGVADILDLPTAETDTSLRLAPDGAGGVEFAAGGGGPSDYVSGTSGTGQIVVPGLNGSPDRQPASPNAADDEFDSLAGWTTYGSPDVSNVSDFPNHWHVKKASAGGNAVYGIYKASPGLPFTVTAKLAAFRWDQAYNDEWIGLGDAVTPTKVWGFGINPYYGGPEIAAWTLPATRTASSGANWINAAYYNGAPIYLRLVVHSSTNVDTYYSKDGFIWISYSTGSNPGLTVGTIWLGVAGSAGSANYDAVFGGIRFS